jgi:hypothetical protein
MTPVMNRNQEGRNLGCRNLELGNLGLWNVGIANSATRPVTLEPGTLEPAESSPRVTTESSLGTWAKLGERKKKRKTHNQSATLLNGQVAELLLGAVMMALIARMRSLLAMAVLVTFGC